MAVATQFKVGDTVYLTDRNLPMTVTGFSSRGKVWVEWELPDRTDYPSVADAKAGTNGRPHFEEHSFPPECLTLLTPASPAA